MAHRCMGWCRTPMLKIVVHNNFLWNTSESESEFHVFHHGCACQNYKCPKSHQIFTNQANHHGTWVHGVVQDTHVEDCCSKQLLWNTIEFHFSTMDVYAKPSHALNPIKCLSSQPPWQLGAWGGRHPCWRLLFIIAFCGTQLNFMFSTMHVPTKISNAHNPIKYLPTKPTTMAVGCMGWCRTPMLKIVVYNNFLWNTIEFHVFHHGCACQT